MRILEALGISLALTLVCELIFALLAGVRGKSDLALVALVNVVTNPAVVFVYIVVGVCAPAWRVPAMILLELGALVTEWLLYKKYLLRSRMSPFALALTLNAASFLAGELISFLR